MLPENWNGGKTPPPSALKKISAGRLAGKTDINPQWRIQKMTEIYGMCGDGWKYEIERMWTEQGNESQVAAFSLVKLYTKNNGKWSEPIPGIGGSMFVVKESRGMHCNDEAYKMATTDALSVAMKQIGIGSDIYMGLWDGSKYKPSSNNKFIDMMEKEKKRIGVKSFTDAIKKYGYNSIDEITVRADQVRIYNEIRNIDK